MLVCAWLCVLACVLGCACVCACVWQSDLCVKECMCHLSVIVLTPVVGGCRVDWLVAGRSGWCGYSDYHPSACWYLFDVPCDCDHPLFQDLFPCAPLAFEETLRLCRALC